MTRMYVVVPCYNEEAVLMETASRLRKKLEELEQVRCVTSGLDCKTLLAVFERNLNRMTELEPYEDSSGYPVAG